MFSQRAKFLIPFFFLLFGWFAFHNSSQAQKAETIGSVPKTWDEQALAGFYVPLTDARRTPVPVSPDYYYRIPVRKIYKSYPIYAPGKEPPGYMQWLREQEPEEVAFDFTNCKTDEDWSRIGAVVFEAPLRMGKTWNGADLSDPAFWRDVNLPVAGDGTMPFAKYAIRKKGEIEIADGGCILCHTRVMPGGSILKGAQGNLPAGRFVATVIRRQAAETKDAAAWLTKLRTGLGRYEGMPWLRPDPAERVSRISADEVAAAFAAIPAGAIDRLHSSLFFSGKIADLIGVGERRYLNHTGLSRHRGIGDLMRYAALVQGMNEFDRFGDFMYAPALPDPATLQRYSDEQLYAVAQYVYSLKPPPNPNPFDGLAARGQQVFARENARPVIRRRFTPTTS